MAVPVITVNTVFGADQISLGAVLGNGPFLFTETTPLANTLLGNVALGPGAKVTVTGVTTNAVTGVQTLTGVISGSTLGLADGQLVTGTVTGNDAGDILVNGTVAGVPANVLFTNAAVQQPGVGNVLTVQPPSANITFSPACYCTGTLIRTARGEVPVEDLRIGDAVVSTSGALRPVRWIGTRSYAGRFLAGHDHLLPVRIRAGALADGVPRRDLLVSPKHAMLLDGALVPAGLLVNGSTVVRETGLARVDYVHVELDGHDTIWAEGAASETFVDDDSRGMFHNAATYAALYPLAAPVPALYCAPRVEDGLPLQAARDAVNARAGLAQAA